MGFVLGVSWAGRRRQDQLLAWVFTLDVGAEPVGRPANIGGHAPDRAARVGQRATPVGSRTHRAADAILIGAMWEELAFPLLILAATRSVFRRTSSLAGSAVVPAAQFCARGGTTGPERPRDPQHRRRPGWWRPRRAIRRTCGRTDVLLSAWLLPRRHDRAAGAARDNRRPLLGGRPGAQLSATRPLATPTLTRD